MKAAIYTRVSNPTQLDHDQQRENILAKIGDTHEIMGEYRDIGSGSQGVGNQPGLMKLLDDAAKGEFDVLFCTDLTRLTRQLSPEILAALNRAGVRVVMADGDEISFGDLVAQILMDRSARTASEIRSERMKAGKRAAHERRMAKADNGSE